MALKSMTVRHNGSELFVVPAAHFDYVFALEVNRICASPTTRPDAVAVELGPEAADAAMNWLGELGAGPNGRKKLPVMLGLLKRNRMIRRSFREKALELQRKTGKDLSELPPEILHRELGYSGCSLLCLSPTDSIIEAIRCGIELDVPIYGVDLEEMADGDYKPIVVQDTGGAGENLIAYTAQNAPYAEQQRDEEIDGQREIVMAARIKTLLQRHRRVVFTCGMAHWLRIRQLLDDPSIQPGRLPERKEKAPGAYKRVVVHPLIAVRYMGAFPALVAKYERIRPPPACDPPDKTKIIARINPDTIFKSCLQRATRNYFCRALKGVPKTQRNNDLESLQHFEDYLKNLCLLNLRLTPDIFITIKAAQEMMSKEFVSEISKALMKFPWTSRREHPDCAFLSPPGGARYEPGRVVLMNDKEQKGEYFWIRSSPVNGNTSHDVEIPYEFEKLKKVKAPSLFGCTLHTWLPWDYLITSLSLRAIKTAKAKQRVRKVEVFTDSILQGIDIKTTLRAFSRGKERIYVRDDAKGLHSDQHPADGFPVVWIIKPEQIDGGSWNVLCEPCSYMEKYIRNKQNLRKIEREKGTNMVATIGYGELDQRCSASSRVASIRSDYYRGIILFMPIGWTNKQFARWAELTGYRRNPLCHDSSLGEGVSSDLADFYERVHGVTMGEFHWPTTMILLALPFAKDILTVAVPGNYRIERVAFERARKYGVRISAVSLDTFNDREIERLRLCYLVPTITHEPECVYPKSIEKTIGESQEDNRGLVPSMWLNFGNDLD